MNPQWKRAMDDAAFQSALKKFATPLQIAQAYADDALLILMHTLWKAARRSGRVHELKAQHEELKGYRS